MDGYRSVTLSTADRLITLIGALSIKNNRPMRHQPVALPSAHASVANRRSHSLATTCMHRWHWVLVCVCLVFLSFVRDVRANNYPSAAQSYAACMAQMLSLEAEYQSGDYIMYVQCAPGINPQATDEYGFNGYHYSGVIINPAYVAYNRPFDWWPVYHHPSTLFDSKKNLGCSCQRAPMSPFAGDPMNLATGNQYEAQTDFSQGDLERVPFPRTV